MTTEEVIREAMTASEELTIKHCIFQITDILSKDRAIKILKVCYETLEAELNIYGK